MDSDWSSGLDLFVDLDRAGPGRSGGLRDGIEHALRDAMRTGRLDFGAALPSSRSLARDLGVARGTVSAAYGQLAVEGYLELRQGALPRVSWAGRGRSTAEPAITPFPRHPMWDLRPGRPDSASFPRAAWTRAHRKVLARAPDECFGYGDPRGSVELRRALAGYLGRARGVAADPGLLLVCAGFTQALALLCLTLRRDGVTVLAVEDPCAPRYRALARTMGLDVVPVACDENGLLVERLALSGARAVLVTPAHQYPLGIIMSAARRTALAEWARSRQALIIEDDYDGEFRYDRQPVGALQPLDPDHVAYVGSASKTLAPGLRIGWLAVPGRWAAAVVAMKENLDRGGGILDQLTLAELIGSGGYDRQIRLMRTSYRRRRDDLAREITGHPARLRLAGIAAGLHAIVYLPADGPTADQVRDRAARNSIALDSLTGYWASPPEPCPQGIIVGFGAPAGHAYRPALRALCELLQGELLQGELLQAVREGD